MESILLDYDFFNSKIEKSNILLHFWSFCQNCKKGVIKNKLFVFIANELIRVLNIPYHYLSYLGLSVRTIKKMSGTKRSLKGSLQCPAVKGVANAISQMRNLSRSVRTWCRSCRMPDAILSHALSHCERANREF